MTRHLFMKSHLAHLRVSLTEAGVLFCVAGWLAASSAYGAPLSEDKSPSQTATNLLALTTNIPQSVFVVPQDPREGRDPFFPDATPQPVVTNTNKTSPGPVHVDFTLQGISGTSDHRLAIINNTTLGEGEIGEVVTPTGKVTIRCVQITEDSAIIEYGNERRELKISRTR